MDLRKTKHSVTTSSPSAKGRTIILDRETISQKNFIRFLEKTPDLGTLENFDIGYIKPDEDSKKEDLLKRLAPLKRLKYFAMQIKQLEDKKANKLAVDILD